MSSSLPRLILDLVVARGQLHGHAAKRLVIEVRTVLRIALRPAHRAMCSSRMESIRKNARQLRALYANGALASAVFSAAHDGDHDKHTRLEQIAKLIRDRLTQVLRVLHAWEKKLAERLESMLQIAMPRPTLA